MVNKISADQLEALDDFKRYLESDANYMVVSGAAGTGKTTLIQELQTAANDNSWKCIPLGVWGRSSSAIVQITGIPSVTVAKYNRVHQDIARNTISQKALKNGMRTFIKKNLAFFIQFRTF